MSAAISHTISAHTTAPNCIPTNWSLHRSFDMREFLVDFFLGDVPTRGDGHQKSIIAHMQHCIASASRQILNDGAFKTRKDNAKETIEEKLPD
eukprot:4096357-Amphidinium_carterae.1